MTDDRAHSAGFISGRATSSNNPASLYRGEYDLVVVVSSWDKRSICISEALNLKAHLGLLMLFSLRDSHGLRDKHDSILKSFIDTACEEAQFIEGNSIALQEIWEQLLTACVRLRRALGRPLTVLIDGSACPRYYLLGLAATALGTGLAAAVTVTYAEGVYPVNLEGGPEDIVFTQGHWKLVAIPGLEGRYSPGLKRFFLVSIGFEGWKTMRAVTRADPDRVSILHASPGTNPGYGERSKHDNADLIDYYRIPPDQILSAPAGNAIAAWRTLTLGNIERPALENSYFLCSGTKPHSLALALRAMSLRTPAVLYNLPEAHQALPIEPNGTYWRFDIESLTVPR